MLNFLKENEKQWVENVYRKLENKIEKECGRIGEKIPYIAENGRYRNDMGESNIAWWTNGFWGGLLWQLYHAAVKPLYMQKAVQVEERLDRALNGYENLDHDVGFMWMPTAVANYRLTGNHDSLVRGLHAANILAGRFNLRGNYIRAWNGDRTGWMIVDCLMNLSLLYWAAEETKDPRFDVIAERHADTVLEKILRPDGSCNHIAILNPMTGELEALPAGQGFAEGSAWSRGQAWAVYGFAISYAHTKEQKYLDAAKRAAHFFIAGAALTGYLPLCDFRAPEVPVYYDSTAGACAVCGLLEIAKHVPELEKALYEQSALKMLMAMEEHFCNWNEEEDGILGMGKAAYHEEGEEGQVPIIYGDYFFAEAVLRLMEKDFFIW